MDLLDQSEDARRCRLEIVRGVFLNSWVTKGGNGGVGRNSKLDCYAWTVHYRPALRHLKRKTIR